MWRVVPLHQDRRVRLSSVVPKVLPFSAGPSALSRRVTACNPSPMTSADLLSPTTPPALADRPFLVVGFDGSPSSFAALRRGVHLAPLLGADLRVVTSWMFPTSYPGANYGDWSPSDDADGLATTARSSLFPGQPPWWFSSIVAEGMPTRVLLEQSVGADMLIVGSRGHGGSAGMLLGSVSAAVAEHASCPVLIMRAASTPSDDAARADKTLVGARS
jgi:nucleotide-binding universal stress UspA family protein